MAAVSDDAAGWWCWVCHGLGGWEEDGAERGDFGDTEYIDCPCCGGDGRHLGDDAPPCHPSRQAVAAPQLPPSENR